MIRDISGDNPAKRNAHLAVIIDEADRLNLLVEDILELSRVQSGGAPLEISGFNLKDLISGILQSYKLLCEQGGYRIALSAEGDLTVSADRAKIGQVVTNLLNNAVKYCGDDKFISISVKKAGARVRCEIEDHGMGIPQSEVEQIWERYYKASTNHIRSTAGTGLGLAITKEILTLHGADYGVNSEYGSGSTFWFEL